MKYVHAVPATQRAKPCDTSSIPEIRTGLNPGTVVVETGWQGRLATMNVLSSVGDHLRARSRDPRRQLTALGPVAQLHAGRMPWRLSQLMMGLTLYGLSMAMLVRATLGVLPWDVLHQGLTTIVPWSFGTVVIVTSIVVLLLWIPIRQLPGLGSLLNAVVVGIVADLVLAVLSEPQGLAARAVLMLAGILLNGIATAMYIGSQLGPGPRDGLMTGLARRTGVSIRVVRTSLEVAVVVVGWLLGGVVGLGTVLYAVVIGPLTQLMLPWFTVPLAPAQKTPAPTQG